ncbi:ATP-dependent DNA helicase RecG [Shouchella clausii]|uniref:ATP-dependent DNA helicase RecG n=1 Tax=Shouchella TaxID=2893057 RepID=UPI00079C838A|nr:MULTISPECIES: ATP-dependent DNA helicase RecG [Shouchella]MCM3312234.1 ATP-dependent DNA helicase RecG [Psychrobacillus sp. MER TA 17]KKI87792.1 ATP-dependent DNA helicase [Shouchella clausii]MBX0320008.1 ATP-dependent DNA helicase RecG [Shouchella clausii]PAD48326.1 DNA helicase RecG [Shouchella clausii]SHL13834.1 ATP-dependent DNA helicase RecG [Shouchella rhizosphaerae]
MSIGTLDVTAIKGVGEESGKLLNKMGILTVGDLLEYFPFRYEDYALKRPTEAAHDERVTMAGKIQNEASVRYYGKNKNRLTFRIEVDGVLVTATFFNRAFLKSKLQPGMDVTVTGKWDAHRLTITGSELKFGIVEREGNLEPVYHSSGKVTSKALQKWIAAAFSAYGSQIEDPLPESIRKRYKLMGKGEALRHLHYPFNREATKQARRRYVYEELLLFQLKMRAFKEAIRNQQGGRQLDVKEDDIAAFTSLLPFPLTGAQQRAIADIVSDIRSPLRMNRLLQGDVGSGKTAVAAACMAGVVGAGGQCALMAPTEILAEQHATTIEAWFEPLGLKTALLVGSVKGKKRRELLDQIAKGEVDIVIGTHALIQEDVVFSALSLVITDEQHRFGVEQRRILRDKGEHPDVLFMTATPIPRTLAISVFGDMDVSVLDEMPAGRKPIETYWVQHEMLERVLEFVRKEVKKGRQAYVICPLIEESEKLDVQNAIDFHSMLTAHFQGDAQVGLMHGRLQAAEKEAVMAAFARNELRILVSTTVVEVGVNVPNATVMVIYDADRFGLAQLHQLRGRVGRGDEKSYCILVAQPKTEVGKERMRIMTETSDGFVLSERDLELRGPGDFFGSKQSGLPDFKLADVVHDYRTLEAARQDADRIFKANVLKTDPEYRLLYDYLKKTGAFEEVKLD